MVGKRRPHKTPVVYKKVIGKGLPSAAPSPDEEAASEEEDTGGDPADESEAVHSAVKHAAGPFHDLPLELIDLICSLSPRVFNFLFVNKQWYTAALPHVYSDPSLTSANFMLFVNAISNDREVGAMVRSLDLVKIAQNGKNSMVSRLLRRCSPKLEQFTAPQSRFGYAPMVSLASCHRLRTLDLSLVSETVDLPQLFKVIQNFRDLEVLQFPRSSIECGQDADLQWPPNLRRLGLSGGFPSEFIERTTFSEGLIELQISNCPFMGTQSLLSLLSKIGPQLKRLAVFYPMPLLGADALDNVFILCPNLKTLRVSVDYISSDLLDSKQIPKAHPLQNLTLASSGLMGHADKVRPGDVLLATESLTELKRVSTSFQLGWNPESSTLMGLVDTMNQRGGGVWLS